MDLPFTKLFDKSELPAGWEIVRVAFDWNLEPLLLIREGKPPMPSLEAADPYAYSRWINEPPTAHHLIYWESGERKQLEFKEANRLMTFNVQRLHEGWMLAEARGGEAVIYDGLGNPSGKTFDVGDAIEDLQTTSNGHIWVSYFDEGVFGNGIGAAGAICFDSSGVALFRYSNVAEKLGLPFIDDCYSMNVVSNEEVWISYYSEFPLVRIQSMKPELLRGGIDPTRGFAITSNRMVGVRAYTQGELFSIATDDDEIRDPEVATARDERNKLIDGPFSGACRGNRVALIQSESIYLGSI